MTEIEQIQFRINVWRDEIAHLEHNIKLAEEWLADNHGTTIYQATKNIKNKVRPCKYPTTNKL